MVGNEDGYFKEIQQRIKTGDSNKNGIDEFVIPVTQGSIKKKLNI